MRTSIVSGMPSNSQTQSGNTCPPAFDSQNARWRGTCTYLSLSFASGFVELGSLLYAIRLEAPTFAVIAIGLAYQLGALAQNPFALRWGRHPATPFIAVASAVVAQWDYRAVWLAVLLLSIVLQDVREETLKLASVGTFPKRVARILGFATSGSFSPLLMTLICVLVILAARMVGRLSSGHRSYSRCIPKYSTNILGAAMVLHQMHYFAYAYIMPIVFIRVHALGYWYAGLAFALGWISYSITPSVLSRLPSVSLVVYGHVCVAATLFLMACYYDRLVLLLAAWFASGFGGGTVFGIRRLAVEKVALRRTGDLDIWENVGHVVGVIVAIVVVFIDTSPRVTFLVASGLSLLVAIIVLATKWRLHPDSDSVGAGPADGRPSGAQQ